MKKYFILTIIGTSFIATSCSKAQDIAFEKENIAKEQKESPKITSEDQIIVDKFTNLVKRLGTSENEGVKVELKALLPEVSQIKNKVERERIQENIYSTLRMYKESYDLNEKQLEENPTGVKQYAKCQLLEILNSVQEEIKSCNQVLAPYIQKELEDLPKDDPQYPYGKWSYLLAMYKAGHTEYKQKMEAFIASTSDERMKSEFQSSYDVATEQK